MSEGIQVGAQLRGGAVLRFQGRSSQGHGIGESPAIAQVGHTGLVRAVRKFDQ